MPRQLGRQGRSIEELVQDLCSNGSDHRIYTRTYIHYMLTYLVLIYDGHRKLTFFNPYRYTLG